METACRKVFFIRHAKSAWDDADLADINRQLNERGHSNAIKMADFIYRTFKLNDIEFISSPAQRALSTAHYFLNVYGYSKSDIRLDKNLYEGSDLDYLRCLHILPEKTKVAFVFGHNPTIESLVSKLNKAYHGLVPTCAVFYTTSIVGTWKIKEFNDLKLENYYFPKTLIN